MAKHSIYFSEAVTEKMSPLTSAAEGVSTRISRLCMIAVDCMAEEIPELPLGEWMALLEVSNGAWYQDNSPATIANSFLFSVMESGMELDEKWGVNCVALAEKLNGMRLIQKMAIVDMCRRIWASPDKSAKFKNWRDILVANGAKVSEFISTAS